MVVAAAVAVAATADHYIRGQTRDVIAVDANASARLNT
jgi:hypothetical protein